MAIVEPAPAKVNLALHVTGRRDDGYHIIETLAVFTELGDTVTLAPAARDSFTVEGPFAHATPADGANLVLAARDLLRAIAPDRARDGVAITLRKALPVASGIGGGSSDAAATLRGLARLWGVPAGAWQAAAPRLGADLPMCLAGRPLVASGIGERVAPLLGFPALALVLVNPAIAVSTPDVFQGLTSRENGVLPAVPRLASPERVAAWLAATRNDLQPPAMALAPAIAEAMAELLRTAPLLARMSGSGATCFGLFDDDAKARNAARAIAARRPGWFVAATTTSPAERSSDAAA